MDLSADDFALFGLPRRHALSVAEVDARWKALQSQVHPDRFVAEGAAAQRRAAQWAMRVNEAHRRLRDPMRRAAYLCELAGAPIEAENNTAMPGDFLTRQMAWREALDDARTIESVQQLADAVAADRSARLAALSRTLDERGDAFEAARQVRALMFIERFAADVDARLERLGA